MAKTTLIKNAMPQSSQPVRVSRAAVGLLCATVILAVILTFSTLKNIDRAQLLMENFLQDKGETIVRSIEAGSRASMVMMHHVSGINPMHTLLIETSKEEDIFFIAIYDTNGSVIDKAGSPESETFSPVELESMLTSNQVVTRLNPQTGVFTYSKAFSIGDRMRRMHLPPDDRKQWLKQLAESKKIISIGLLTEEFDSARKQDARHALFMGAILFLVCTAGLYVLYLYQKMRKTSATLADMKLYTDSVLESVPISLITLDAGDRVVSCNRNTEDLFGHPLEDLLTQNIHATFPTCSDAITDSCTTELEHSATGRGGDGREIPLRISCSPLVNHENEKIGKVLAIRDMSSIRNMEIQLERSRRMAALGKMAAGIAHEIRNPLGTLRGFAQFFGNQPEVGDDGKKYSELMISEIERLNHTVSGLLQFSRSREPEFKPVLLDALFRKTATLMDADIRNHNVQFQWQSNTGIVLNIDPDLILQVLLNLLKNSINATDKRDKISLYCTEYEHEVGIIVDDNGCGMSESEREKMFDPFFTTTKTGTGLGLAVSHQIVEQHHGRFEVVTKKGCGTTITMLLPKKQSEYH